MSIYDSRILAISTGSFVFFLFLHFLIFRYISRQSVLKWIMNLFIIAAVADVAMVFLCFSQGFHLTLAFGYFVFFAFLSLSIYGFLSFLYVVCIFGPYESSIRFRLIRELYKGHPHGLTKEEILKRYNTKTILEERIQRLVYAGDIFFDGKIYHLGKRFNFFLLFDYVRGPIKKIIHKRKI